MLALLRVIRRNEKCAGIHLPAHFLIGSLEVESFLISSFVENTAASYRERAIGANVDGKVGAYNGVYIVTVKRRRASCRAYFS